MKRENSKKQSDDYCITYSCTQVQGKCTCTCMHNNIVSLTSMTLQIMIILECSLIDPYPLLFVRWGKNMAFSSSVMVPLSRSSRYKPSSMLLNLRLFFRDQIPLMAPHRLELGTETNKENEHSKTLCKGWDKTLQFKIFKAKIKKKKKKTQNNHVTCMYVHQILNKSSGFV